MTDTSAAERSIEIVDSIGEVGRAVWDGLANPGWPAERPLDAGPAANRPSYNPFISYDFLSSLEESGSATRKTGWLPQHLFLKGAAGEPAGAMPCYLKSHSRGEYVFDHGWADAYERAGGSYYPKLQSSVPFTPVTTRRLLVRPDDEAGTNRNLLAFGATELTRRHRASSIHATFLTEPEWEVFREAGYLQRTDRQFHFVNDGYRDFEDFLEALASRKRKAIRRERRDALADGIEVHCLTGPEIEESHWDAFFRFYMDTGSRKWGTPYLNRRFFALIGERMSDRVLLVLAKRGRKWIAGALNFIGSETLYGRYWGCVEEQPFLHFELCYYQAIEWGLLHGMKTVEAGAQGEHKIARGYRPMTTRSAHWIADPGFREAVASYLERERRAVSAEISHLSEHVPFRHEDGDLADEP